MVNISIEDKWNLEVERECGRGILENVSCCFCQA